MHPFGKLPLINHCLQLLDTAVAEIKQQMQELVTHAANDSKSSAGDKHETGRAMMQQAQEQLGKQLQEAEMKRASLARMLTLPVTENIGEGSLVVTHENTLLLGAPIGKVTFEEMDVFVISMQSPLAQALKGKKAGDSIVFQQKTIQLLHVQ
jgi:transcription elongation GreA/GreB family factor